VGAAAGPLTAAAALSSVVPAAEVPCALLGSLALDSARGEAAAAAAGGAPAAADLGAGAMAHVQGGAARPGRARPIELVANEVVGLRRRSSIPFPCSVAGGCAEGPARRTGRRQAREEERVEQARSAAAVEISRRPGCAG
jgi:hypothetical protein